MSAIGPKRTSLVAPHMSAFRGKADMTIWACLLLRSLLGVKRTWVGALHMSAFDPKRTSRHVQFHPVGPQSNVTSNPPFGCIGRHSPVSGEEQHFWWRERHDAEPKWFG